MKEADQKKVNAVMAIADYLGVKKSNRGDRILSRISAG